MKKIVIVGALGYLGTELCKIYSGESWFNKIVALDSRFVSERVNQFKDWNIEFFQGHILDLDFLKNHLHGKVLFCSYGINFQYTFSKALLENNCNEIWHYDYAPHLGLHFVL